MGNYNDHPAMPTEIPEEATKYGKVFEKHLKKQCKYKKITKKTDKGKLFFWIRIDRCGEYQDRSSLLDHTLIVGTPDQSDSSNHTFIDKKTEGVVFTYDAKYQIEQIPSAGYYYLQSFEDEESTPQGPIEQEHN